MQNDESVQPDADLAEAVCASCGATGPRGDMFGVEPDLRCEDCAAGVRKRMHVRYKPLAKDHVPRATAACLAVAVALFVATNLIWPRGSGGGQPGWIQMLYQGWSIWLGHVWKHLTSMFLHGGFIHILFNGYVLFMLGRLFEQRYGTPAFLGVLIATGMAGQAAEFIAPTGNAVGLSGGILGLIGFLIARRRDDATAGMIMNDRNLRFVLIYVAAMILLTYVASWNIANVAHVVGLGTGWLLGHASLHAQRKLLVPAAAALCVTIVILSVFVAFGDTVTNQGPMSRMDARERYVEQNR